MQFIQNHVSARYLSFHVTLVISISRSLVHCCVLFHCLWNTDTLTHSVNVEKSHKEALNVKCGLFLFCFFKKKWVLLQRQLKNFFWCTETRGVIFIMYIFDCKSSRTITLNLFLHLIRWCFILLCIQHFGFSRNSLAKKLHIVSTKHTWESSGLLQVECGFVPRF